jgi:F0F1-type ATP synthase membrane subunit b/b'
MKSEYGKTIMSYPTQERMKIRDKLEHIKELAKQEKEHSYNCFIKPIDDRIKTIDDFSKNIISNNQFNNKMELINKYIKDVNKLMVKK